MPEPFPMQFSCPGCGAVLEAMSNNAGAVVLCPYCNASMAVPDMTDLPTLTEQAPPLTAPLTPTPKPGTEEEDEEPDRKYYVRKQKKEFGPFSSRELRKLARSGKLAPTDLIWKKGFADWRPAAKARGLFSDPRPPRA